MKKAEERGKRSKTMSEEKLVQNVSKNPQSFLEISTVQKEVLLSHIFFGLNEDKPSQRSCQNQLLLKIYL